MMRDFIQLFDIIDQTTKTNAKIDALVTYFSTANDDDKLWTVALFTHRRPPRAVNTTLLRAWAAELAGLPLWLFEDTYHVVGDLAETISLVVPDTIPSVHEVGSLTNVLTALRSLKAKPEEFKKEFVLSHWNSLDQQGRLVFNKFITGGFRVGVSQKTMTKALSKVTGEEEANIALRLMGNWTPDNTTWHDLLISPTAGEDMSKPYPFYLAYALEDNLTELGNAASWTAEWKWDGIRGQIIRRDNQVYIWSRGEELVTDKYPELHYLSQWEGPDFVIDGEIIPMIDNVPLPFQVLQQRISRKNTSRKMLLDIPIFVIAYDLLELDKIDLRENSFDMRRHQLEKLLNLMPKDGRVIQSERLQFSAWAELHNYRAKSREIKAEGLMLKSNESTYKVGRKKGDWWKWKVEPLEVDAVMIYAQRGHGRRANLYSDFTFAVWNGDLLVPFTKAYSGLTDQEFREVTQYVKNNTIERFGPVSSVAPNLVFTIAFEGIGRSTRHKSGVALRFPRISRWRKDKSAGEADSIQVLLGLLDE